MNNEQYHAVVEALETTSNKQFFNRKGHKVGAEYTKKISAFIAESLRSLRLKLMSNE